jgi:hypothetical protein
MDIYSQKKITAKKGDVIATFSEYNWNKKNFRIRKQGWKRIDGVQEVVTPEEVVKFKVPEKKSAGQDKKDAYVPKVPIEEMKAHLDKLGIKYHPATGAKKLEEKYDEVKEKSV